MSLLKAQNAATKPHESSRSFRHKPEDRDGEPSEMKDEEGYRWPRTKCSNLKVRGKI